MDRGFGYARGSTLDHNLENKLHALDKFRGDRIFQDEITGIAVQKTALNEMLSILRGGDIPVVARFIRLDRGRDHIISLINELAGKKVIFKTLEVPIDSNTPAGKLITSVFASLEEYDPEMILEKTKVGQILAGAKVKHIGRRKAIEEN